jgi:hypothetical protein
VSTADSPSAVLGRVAGALTILAVVLIAGVAVELATARHWHGFEQLIAWASLLLLAAGAALSILGGDGARRAARAVLAVVGAASAFGVWEHVQANLDSGPLDFRYARTWAGFSAGKQWWLAVSGGVGASPPLVPLVLVLVVALVLLADRCRRAAGDPLSSA